MKTTFSKIASFALIVAWIRAVPSAPIASAFPIFVADEKAADGNGAFTKAGTDDISDVTFDLVTSSSPRQLDREAHPLSKAEGDDGRRLGWKEVASAFTTGNDEWEASPHTKFHGRKKNSDSHDAGKGGKKGGKKGGRKPFLACNVDSDDLMRSCVDFTGCSNFEVSNQDALGDCFDECAGFNFLSYLANGR